MNIDIRPTWSGVLAIYDMLLQSENLQGFMGLRQSVSKAFACATALQAIEHTLTDEQKELVNKSLSGPTSIR
ncbi:hypothetical protein [Neisseria sp. Ec49-e6-T10]|uniref:hypothetical protein n=1 Tax=Neisseria sp. Ec49-e6-T10 TaxID=3140744 RepID=UPI003EC122CF